MCLSFQVLLGAGIVAMILPQFHASTL